MAIIKSLIVCIAVAVAHHVQADKDSNQGSGFQFPSIPGFGPGSNFPNFNDFFGGGSSGFPGFNIPGFPSIPGFPGGNRPTSTTSEPTTEPPTTEEQPSTAEVPDSSDRKRRDVVDQASENDVDDSERQNRLFFTRFPTITSCNSTTQAGSSCLSCTQALRCLPNNFGLLTTCRGLFRHCNNGTCSITRSGEC